MYAKLYSQCKDSSCREALFSCLVHPHINKSTSIYVCVSMYARTYSMDIYYDRAMYNLQDMIINRLYCKEYSMDQCIQDVNRSMALAISYIHGKGFVHGDVKMTNILVYPGYVFKLSDFETCTSSDILGATIEYLPPEGFTGDTYHVTRSYDVWALGRCIHLMCTGYTKDTQSDIHRTRDMLMCKALHVCMSNPLCSNDDVQACKKILSKHVYHMYQPVQHVYTCSPQSLNMKYSYTVYNAITRYKNFCILNDIEYKEDMVDMAVGIRDDVSEHTLECIRSGSMNMCMDELYMYNWDIWKHT